MKVAVIGNSSIDFVKLRQPLLTEIINNGNEVTLIGPHIDSKETNREINQMGVKYFPYNINPVGVNPILDISTFYRIFKLLKQIQPDIVLLFTLKPIFVRKSSFKK